MPTRCDWLSHEHAHFSQLIGYHLATGKAGSKNSWIFNCLDCGAQSLRF